MHRNRQMRAVSRLFSRSIVLDFKRRHLLQTGKSLLLNHLQKVPSPQLGSKIDCWVCLS